MLCDGMVFTLEIIILGKLGRENITVKSPTNFYKAISYLYREMKILISITHDKSNQIRNQLHHGQHCKEIFL